MIVFLSSGLYPHSLSLFHSLVRQYQKRVTTSCLSLMTMQPNIQDLWFLRFASEAKGCLNCYSTHSLLYRGQRQMRESSINRLYLFLFLLHYSSADRLDQYMECLWTLSHRFVCCVIVCVCVCVCVCRGRIFCDGVCCLIMLCWRSYFAVQCSRNHETWDARSPTSSFKC